ncbi:hydrolase [Lysinibacillus sphaericus CBAM5]|uniref:Aromatic hydrocarbon catabolism protein n=2 Tax=Lysinibacillus sphaericus TaxID=1421 RepID=B1HYL8_LYSSC|nr:aromatic hydrocarbon catabolism protein [Lysinibacillus sphaericus C3-41]EWH32216.1 hydrolase [Lysinibacillus sphaericus CBAM5]
MILLNSKLHQERFVNYFIDDAGRKIEYSIIGKGTPILMFHGGHSNCMEDFGYAKLLEHGYSIITPSRAGYGNTDPLIGRDLQSACYGYLTILNHLKIEKVHVIAISAGGPSGILFTSKYPERVRSLTLQSAITKEWLKSKDMEYKVAHIIFRPTIEKYTWRIIGLLSNLFSKFMFKQMAPSFSKLPYIQIASQITYDDIETFCRMNNRQRSGYGFIIDLSQTGTISEADLHSIKCPTLILHSINDSAVPFNHAYHAHYNINDSKLCILESWGHLIWLGQDSERMYDKLIKFLISF